MDQVGGAPADFVMELATALLPNVHEIRRIFKLFAAMGVGAQVIIPSPSSPLCPWVNSAVLVEEPLCSVRRRRLTTWCYPSRRRAVGHGALQDPVLQVLPRVRVDGRQEQEDGQAQRCEPANPRLPSRSLCMLTHKCSRAACRLQGDHGGRGRPPLPARQRDESAVAPRRVRQGAGAFTPHPPSFVHAPPRRLRVLRPHCTESAHVL